MINSVVRSVLLLSFVSASFSVLADDPSWSYREWYSRQMMNDGARQRLGVPFKSCCDAGDAYKTRFRVAADNSDQWQYWKDGEWKIVPSDIVKEDDTPENKPVLFINRHTGQELCFIVPKGGI